MKIASAAPRRFALVLSSLAALLLLAGCWSFLDGLWLENSPPTRDRGDEWTISMQAGKSEVIGLGLGYAGLLVFLALYLTRRRPAPPAAPEPIAPFEY